MNNKTLLISLLITLLVGCFLGWFTRGCSIPKVKERITKDTVYVTKSELTSTAKDSILTFKKNETKREDKISVKDSIGNEGSVTINTESTDSNTVQKVRLVIKPIEIIKTQIKEITKTVIEYQDKPFYMNDWFWKFLIATGLFLLALFY